MALRRETPSEDQHRTQRLLNKLVDYRHSEGESTDPQFRAVVRDGLFGGYYDPTYPPAGHDYPHTES